jgi:hypothetical protein
MPLETMMLSQLHPHLPMEREKRLQNGDCALQSDTWKTYAPKLTSMVLMRRKLTGI